MRRVVTILLLTLTVSACSGRRAQSTLSALAIAVDNIDLVLAREISQKAQACYSEPTYDQWSACMAPVRRSTAALAVAASTLRAAQDAVNAASRRRKGAVVAQWAPCVAGAVAELVSALGEAGVSVPGEVLSLLDFAEAYGGICGP